MDDLLIKKRYNVLEVGGGNHPDKRAHVVVDKYVEDNTHRSGDLKVLKNQRFLQADGEHLPFKDQEFDYVICRHVLEHVDDPIQFVKEQARVAKRGYMETPSLLGEYIAPKESHRWLIQDIDNKLVLYDKEVLQFKPWMDFGEVFLYYLPKTSIGFKILERTHAPIITINYEWENEIEILVNPQDEYYMNHFIKPWDESICDKLLIKRSYGRELGATMSAMFDIMRSVKPNWSKLVSHYKRPALVLAIPVMDINAEALIFDLDNTIYPVHAIADHLFEQLFALLDEHAGSLHYDIMLAAKDELKRRPYQLVAHKYNFGDELTSKGLELLQNITYDLPMDAFPEYHDIKTLGIKADFEEIHIVDPQLSAKTKRDVFADISARYQYTTEETPFYLTRMINMPTLR
eukprot:gene7462-7526_t